MPIFKIRNLFPYLLVVFSLFGQSSQPAKSTPGAPHSEAPDEMAQLAFIIGEWKLDIWFAQEDGSKRTGSASLTARYVLDGLGILLEGRYPREGKTDFVSNTVFVFNTRLGKWIGSGINTLGNRKDFEGSFENGKAVFVQSGMQFNGAPGINRITYIPISDKEFKLIYDYSKDDGATWREGTFGYTATRIR